jgi:hypothetical protein
MAARNACVLLEADGAWICHVALQARQWVAHIGQKWLDEVCFRNSPGAKWDFPRGRLGQPMSPS